MSAMNRKANMRHRDRRKGRDVHQILNKLYYKCKGNKKKKTTQNYVQDVQKNVYVLFQREDFGLSF